MDELPGRLVEGGILAATISYLFSLLVKNGNKRMADTTRHYEARLAAKDAEITRLESVIRALRGRGQEQE